MLYLTGYLYINSFGSNKLEEIKLNKMSILNNFFSRNTFRHCLDDGKDKNYTSVIKRYIVDNPNKVNSKLISEIYTVLKKDYRNEYFYKNTLLNKLLLEKHNVLDTSAFTELPIANSKADFLLINGKAVVYEIKTELDNLERLENQINDYYKAFDHVCVVTYEKNLPIVQDKIKDIGKPVGICILNSKNELNFIKEAAEYKNDLTKDVIFKILRKKEFEEILLKHYSTLPVVSDFKYYSECKKLFNALSLDELYLEFLQILKKRTKIIIESFQKVPYELKFLSYFMNLKSKDYLMMDQFLNNVYGGV